MTEIYMRANNDDNYNNTMKSGAIVRTVRNQIRENLAQNNKIK